MSLLAAGGLLWRPEPDGAAPLIGLVHRPRYDDWTLPKGKLEAGEHPLLAGVREVLEETATYPVVGRRLPTQSYLVTPSTPGPPIAVSPSDRASHPTTGRRKPVTPGAGDGSKTVEYWAMRAGTGETGQRDDEVDEVRWFAPTDARRQLSYAGDRDVLRAFLAVPLDLTVLLLVRHATAGRRADWPGDDRLRPLDRRGWSQARRLRTALAWFGPGRTVAADRTRCVQTVAPLAEALGQDVETDPAFSEEAYAAAPDEALRRLRALTERRVTTVLCSQGGVIPALVGTLSGQDGTPVVVRGRRDGRPDGLPPARKGSTWALFFHGGRLVAADYYPHFRAPTPTP